MSWIRTLCACAALAFAASGCANLLTSRAIDGFSEGYAAGDLEQLRKVTSERFERQALRLPEAGNDLKVLNLPKGKVTVLKTEDLDDGKKHVTVQVGESESNQKTLEYHLVRAEGKYLWEVDDVFVTQNKGGKGGPVTKSITEQMDLLLTVREFIAAWKSGSRDEVLAVANDELKTALSELPPTYLNQITKQAVEGVSERSMRPEARIDEDRAVVKLSRSRGGMMISLSRDNDRWLVTDVAADAKDGEATASVRIIAGTIQTAVNFLNAYSTNDLEGIAAVSEPEFDKKLAGADLTTVPMPVVGMLATKYEYLHHGDAVDFVVPQGTNKYVISLKRQTDEKHDRLHKQHTYLVSEVTLYEAGTNEVKRLSSIFTAHAVVEIFADALIARDRARLMALSTSDFNKRAWEPAGDVILQAIPLPEIEHEAPRVVATVYQGPVTEVTATQGGKPLTYVLRSGRTGLQVDDVLLPVTGRPNSLKENVELLAPLYGFVVGLQHHDMDLLRKTSGAGLCRMVWSHSDSVPSIALRPDDYLLLPVRTIKTGDDRSLIELSDGTRTARVVLVRERQGIVVQNVQFEAGKGSGQQLELLQAMRDVVSRNNSLVGGSIPIPRGSVAEPEAASGVIPVGGSRPATTRRPRVSNADFAPSSDPFSK
jgi:hypothetical protein